MTCSSGPAIGRALIAALLPFAAWAADPSGLTQPQALQFGAEQVAVDLRVDLAHGPATLERVDHKVTLSAPLPMDATVLRLRDIVIGTVTSDAGERLGLLLRPAARDQVFAPDHAFNRDRVLRLTFDLTPPWSPCTRLEGLAGAATLTLARGKRREASLAAKADATVDADGVGRIQVTEVGAKGLSLHAPRGLAEHFAGVVAHDAAGKDVPAKTKESLRTDEAVAWSIETDPQRCATLIVSWYPTVADERIAFAVDRIEVPGGIPGLGGLAMPAPIPGPALPKPAAMKLPLQRAILARDRDQVAALLAGGVDLEACEGDGRAALARAASLGDAALVRLLIGQHAAVAAAGRDGWTPLYCAVAAGDADCVIALLAAGADATAKVGDGRSCLDLARDLGRWRLLSLLLGNPDHTF